MQPNTIKIDDITYVRDKPDGQCDGYVPRIMEPIRVESEGGEQ